MHELGLSSKKPYKKCARVVGEVGLQLKIYIFVFISTIVSVCIYLYLIIIQ